MMNRISGWMKYGLSFLALLAMASPVPAAVVINFSEVGSDVVVTVSGSLSNLVAISFGNETLDNYLISRTGPSAGNTIKFSNMGGSRNIYLASQTSGPTLAWASQLISLRPDSVSLTGLDYFFFTNSALSAQVDLMNYSPGTPISGQFTFLNKTLAGMYLPTSFTEYVYQLTSGGDTITVQFGSSGGGAVPEPTSMAIFGLGALGLAYRSRRKSNLLQLEGCPTS
jgi:hypothetical protein